MYINACISLVRAIRSKRDFTQKLTQALPAKQQGSVIIPPGFYDVDWFEFLLNAITGVPFRVHRDLKRVTLTVVDASLNVRLNKELAKLFNLPKVKLAPNVIYEGKYNMNPFKLLFIHCPQLNGSYNYHNGQPSNVLDFFTTKGFAQAISF